jgi:RNA polymerase sigma-70 factor (ECF subfamily)
MQDMTTLVEPLIPALRRYARSLLRDRAGADDLVQDCLEHAVRSWHRRRPEGDARSWVFAILHNLAINRLRQRARRGAHLALDQASDEALASAPAQEMGLHHHDLMRALDSLPEDQRSTLLLVSVEGLSYAEVAQVLDVPVGTVMSRLSRARHKLMQIMETGERGAETGRPQLRRIK